MAYTERREYVWLARYSRHTPETIARLADLRKWRDRDDMPAELRTRSYPVCLGCGCDLPPEWYVPRCPDC